MVFLGLSTLVVGSTDSEARLELVPYPTSAIVGESASHVDENHFSIRISDCHADCDLLQRAIDRYVPIILQPPGSTGTVFRLSIFENRINASVPKGNTGQIVQLSIEVSSSEAVELQLGVDESYALDVPVQGKATLSAPTVWGALRGLETFAQLVTYQVNYNGGSGLFIFWTPLLIEDSPRYPWRGVMVDTARHYLSIDVLQRTVDTMAAMKLNTLHWHIVDAESFPFASEVYPELLNFSAYHPKASYSKSDISSLIDFARDRGVRVVPEFDTPGHTASIGQTFPKLIADCYDWLVESNGDNLRWPMFNDIALDVTKDETKVFVENIIQELAPLFPDSFFHIGGDEVNQGCWNAVPSILEWMRNNGFATYDEGTTKWEYDFTGLQGNWTSFVQDVTRRNNKRAIVWEEAFSLGFELSADTIVHIWIPDDGSGVLQKAIEAGHNVVLSNGWYLDRQAPTCVDDSSCSVNWMWIWTGRDMYAVEPLAPSSSGWVPNEDEAKMILGGEAAAWGESTDDKNFDARVWSRSPGMPNLVCLYSSYLISVIIIRNYNWRRYCRTLVVIRKQSGPMGSTT